MMVFFGTLFGIIGVTLAHIVIKFYAQYYLMLIVPLFMAWLLGFGLALGAKIGRCTRMNIVSALVVLLFSAACYGGLLFLNDYHDQQEPLPATIVDEALLLAEDGQNFLHKLPYAGDYVPLATDTEREAQHLGVAATNFADRFLESAQEPLVIGTIFDLALITPIRGYLIHDGVTEWLTATDADGEQIREHGQLILSQSFASVWMLWSVEFLLVFLVAILKTRGGAKKALKSRIKKFQKAGLNVDPTQTKPGKNKKEKKKKKKVKTSVIEDVEITPALDAEQPPEEEAPAKGKKKKEKKKKPPKEKKEKKGLFGFGRKKKSAEESDKDIESGADSVEMEFSEDQSLYALILQQYEPARESDLVQLIQQVGPMSPEKARQLLKVPSLLKRDVSAQDAKFAIDKFTQVQAQVKLITMEQLLQIQQKQQGSQAAPPPQPKAAPPAPSGQPPAGSPGEHYALILKRIEPSRQQEILELLASLSGKTADQLQKTLKPPALVLRDATRDEVMMIAQQFQGLQAEVQSLTMSQLKQLMAKNRK